MAGQLGKIVAWIVAVLVVLVVALVVFFLTFDWNRARPWVDDKVSQAIGRQFQITGDLKVGWQGPSERDGLEALDTLATVFCSKDHDCEPRLDPT